MSTAELVSLIGATGAFLMVVSNVLMNRARRKQLYADIDNRRKSDFVQIQEQNQSARDLLQVQLQGLIKQVTESSFGMIDLLQRDLKEVHERQASEQASHQAIVSGLNAEIQRLNAEIAELKRGHANGPRRLRSVNGDD